ncbi:MAG: hypothetical protein E5299_00609 [Burkholderia gladioli]|nr:MAG: hypothetical protein E5299_00609 [Burkholderia gladioli]
MASTGIILGDTNGLRTSEVHHAVEYAASQATEVACEAM